MNFNVSRDLYAVPIVLLALVVSSFDACGRERRDRQRDGNAGSAAVEFTSDGVSMAEYDILFKRNIFSREQPRPKVEYRPPPPQEVRSDVDLERDKLAREKDAAMRADAEIVLIGLIIRDGVGAAVFEDRKAGKSITARLGDPIGSGKVAGINMDAMDFAGADGKKSLIVIGTNLTGQVPLASSSSTTTTSTTTSTTPAPGFIGPLPPPGTVSSSTAAPGGAASSGSMGGAGAAEDANLSVLERMRRKRQRDLNR